MRLHALRHVRVSLLRRCPNPRGGTGGVADTADVTIRPGVVGDADAVASIFIACRAAMSYLPRMHSDAETRLFIRSLLGSEHEVWVAEQDGQLAAFAVLAGDVLEHLYVRPDLQRRGLGVRLLDRAKQHRPEGLALWVFQQNDGARRFYERHGFRLVELTDGRRNMERLPDALYQWRP
jgi:GNAT superfamily N-acetyltransferase